MKINFIDLQAQYRAYKDEIDSEVLEVFSSAQFIGGEKLNSLEKNLATYTGAKHAIGCSSGTDALLLALMALDVGAGDEVITTPFTFIATAEVIALLGAKSVFIDINEDNYNIDAYKIEAAITSKTKAIIPVSLYGQCADMDEINAIAKKHNITVIEDACQSFGATYNGKKSCNLSTIACTSFFPSKPLGAYGDGGAIFTSDDELAAKMRMLLNHGQNERYKHKYIGINGRLDAVQAAILGVKLKHFENEVKLREEIGSRYSNLLEDAAVITPKIKETNTSVYAQYSIRVKDREAMVAKLSALGVPTAVHYPLPLHLQEAFAYLGYKEGDFPISELVSKEIMSLPMSAYLSEAEQDFVVQAIKG
ncbi:MAG: DegT/DnrJ/EryC1/StrS family aminotransferase [Sulfurimonas sp.]|uniref:DegT/DnrJ/EryC1/StrS family aminotransferase n=1 Tax=Sulfurimonas sp. TaxID=2022749 RepID=UPI002604D975|nr:DegT/DnrJ/EryC1/StrS family aminotransferase [Sulfurimonas sp.]MDD5373060.1 DegT/DnrJ/EryC1/StrS family aminotransferase [Sulfurimonas sp.]